MTSLVKWFLPEPYKKRKKKKGNVADTYRTPRPLDMKQFDKVGRSAPRSNDGILMIGYSEYNAGGRRRSSCAMSDRSPYCATSTPYNDPSIVLCNVRRNLRSSLSTVKSQPVLSRLDSQGQTVTATQNRVFYTPQPDFNDRKCSITFNEATVYQQYQASQETSPTYQKHLHPYKSRDLTRSRDLSRPRDLERSRDPLGKPRDRPKRSCDRLRRESSIFGGYGRNTGVRGNTAELSWDQIVCSSDCYQVISTYSTLKQGRWGCTPVSILQPLKTRYTSSNSTKLLYKEIDMLAYIKHPYIIQLLGVSSSPDAVFLMTDYQEKGSLFSLLHKQPNQTLELGTVVEIVSRVCCALSYIHSLGLLHTGISSHSILMGRCIKLGNLGYVQPINSNLTFNTGNFWQWNDVWVNEETLTTASDVYSVGCVLWECLTGKIPWDGHTRESVVLQICRGRKLSKPKRDKLLSELCMQIISKNITSIAAIIKKLRVYAKEQTVKKGKQLEILSVI